MAKLDGEYGQEVDRVGHEPPYVEGVDKTDALTDAERQHGDRC